MSSLPVNPHWIDTDRQLQDCCAHLMKHEVVAVDTEFMRSDTFYPKAALFQLACDDGIYLIDPLPISDFFPLVNLLQSPDVVKVLHSCSEDLEVFSHFLDIVPEPLIDTQIAAALLNYGPSVGYANLVNATQQVELPKGSTRSDWLQRPLSEEQKLYAAQDVAYLLPIYRQLQQGLKDQDRWQWLQEDCDNLIAAAKAPVDQGDYYRRIKSAWKLSRPKQAVLKALSDWREQRARRDNVPRNHLVHEKVLWEIANRLPRSMPQLQNVGGLSPRKIRRYGQDLLDIVEQQRAAEQNPDALPLALAPPLPLDARALMRALRERVAQHAEQLALPPELLAKKADLEFIVRSGLDQAPYQLPPRLQGWRKSAVGDDLIALAESHRTEKSSP